MSASSLTVSSGKTVRTDISLTVGAIIWSYIPPDSEQSARKVDLSLEDLAKWGFSQEVVTVVDLLTHKKGDTYEAYIFNILASCNLDAIAVKITELKHNIARGEAGHHTKSVHKHQQALEAIEEALRETLRQL